MKKGAVFALVISLALLVACAPEQREFPTQEYQPSAFRDDDAPARPVINKTPYDYEEESGDMGVPEDIPREEVDQLSTPVEEYRLELGYGVVGLNTTLGKFAPEFSKYEFPELLKSRNVESELQPVRAKYEQFLRLKGGRIKFTANEQDVVSDYLVYRDEEPIFEYEFHLSQGSFLDYIGEEIWFLGHRYNVKDATKEDVILEGVDTPNKLVIGGGSVHLNGETLEDTESRMTGSSILVVGKADAKVEGDDIFIPVNSSLQEHLGETTLLTDRLDIRYRGVLDVPHSLMEFHNDGEAVELRIDQPFRNRLFIPLGFLTDDGFRLGDDEGMMHARESSGRDDFKVGLEEYFVVTSNVGRDQLFRRHTRGDTGRISAVLQYKGVNTKDNEVEFGSREGIGIKAYYNGTEGVDAKGFLDFAGERFRFFVGNSSDGNLLAIDMDGDGDLDGSSVDFVSYDAIIDLPERSRFNDSANVTVRLIDFLDSRAKEERATFRLNPDGEFTIEFLSDREIFSMGNDNKIAISDFGTQYLLFNQMDDMEFEEILIDHPHAKRAAEIVVEAR